MMSAQARKEAVLDRWDDGQTATEIQRALGFPRPEAVSTIVQRARAAGDVRAQQRHSSPWSRARVSFLPESDLEAVKRLRRAAAERRLPFEELLRLIAVKVGGDDLIDAVLDDGAEGHG